MRSIRRVIHFLRKRRLERELAEEIETHRLMTERRLRDSGMTAADAEAASRRIMGNVTLAREEARAAWLAPWLESVATDVAYSLRRLRRSPGFSAALVAVIALGVGATTAVFSLVDSLVLRSLPVPEPARLVYFSKPAFSYLIFREVHARGAQVFEDVTAWSVERLHVAWDRELEPADVLTASGEFYRTLGIGAVVGRTFTEIDDRIGGGPEGRVAVISYDAWRNRFGSDPGAIGRTIRIGRHTYTIVGVTPAGFFGVAPGLAPEVTIPLTSNQEPATLSQGGRSWVHLLARLRHGIGIDEANAALRTFWPAVLEATTNPAMPAERRAIFLGRTTTLEPGHAGYSRLRNQFATPLWLLLGLGGLLLSVACASAANLLLARGIARQRETAVRLSIGSSRSRLVRQHLIEAFIVALLASAAGLVLARWAADGLVALMNTTQEQIVLLRVLDARIAFFTVALALLTAAISAAIPAFRVARMDPMTGLKDSGQPGDPILRRWSLGKVLVAAQMAVTVILLFGAGLFLRTIERVQARDTGYDDAGVLIVSVDAEATGLDGDSLAAFHGRLEDTLRSIPGVQSASLSMYPPVSNDDGAWTQSVAIDGGPVPTVPGQQTVYFNAISPDYFQTVGLRLLRGRDFTRRDDLSASRVVIVNVSLARQFFPDQVPIGRRITIGRAQARQDLLIVGVVGDATYQRLQESPRSIAYLPWRQHPGGNLVAEVRTREALSTTTRNIRREVHRLNPIAPIRFETINDRIRESLVAERAIAMLATALGTAALALACAGVYGLIAYAVSRQTREIGLRLALGSSRFEILRMVLGRSMVIVVCGIAAGLAGAVPLGRIARALLFEISPADGISLASAAALMLALAALAAFLPARRASRVDPLVALRIE